MERLNNEFISQGHRNGPVCYDEERNLSEASHNQEKFVHFFMEIQHERPDIISDYLNVG